MKFAALIVVSLASRLAFATSLKVVECTEGDTEITSVELSAETRTLYGATVIFYDSQLDRSATYYYHSISREGIRPYDKTTFLGKDFSLIIEAGIGARKGTLQLGDLQIPDLVFTCEVK